MPQGYFSKYVMGRFWGHCLSTMGPTVQAEAQRYPHDKDHTYIRFAYHLKKQKKISKRKG